QRAVGHIPMHQWLYERSNLDRALLPRLLSLQAMPLVLQLAPFWLGRLLQFGLDGGYFRIGCGQTVLSLLNARIDLVVWLFVTKDDFNHRLNQRQIATAE